ncbi:hypothetical protein AAHB37_18700 [Glutamicibacter halophytocola]|uniref:hypothetical protein n=1 Tax=Glutamicibacter halophytocola TaxID=1933880 RepID=UPI00321AE3E2
MTANNPEAFLDKDEAEVPDAISDPARNDEVGQDWTDEGGATPDGGRHRRHRRLNTREPHCRDARQPVATGGHASVFR